MDSTTTTAEPISTNNPMVLYLRHLQQDMSESTGIQITQVIFEPDNGPMLPASFAQSVSYDPECSCDFDASFREERWESFAHQHRQPNEAPKKCHHQRKHHPCGSPSCTNSSPQHQPPMEASSSCKLECVPRAPQRKASFDCLVEAQLSAKKAGNGSVDSFLDKCVFVTSRTLD